MTPWLTAFRRLIRRTPLVGVVALAVVLRLLLLPPMPMAAPAPGDALAELLSGGGICHAGTDAPDSAKLVCPMCPLCAGPAAVLLPAAPLLPGHRATPVAMAVALPPATAPPGFAFALPPPRAPPARSA
jgi:hypothetical protein